MTDRLPSHARIQELLQQALAAEPDEKNFYIRQALQASVCIAETEPDEIG